MVGARTSMAGLALVLLSAGGCASRRAGAGDVDHTYHLEVANNLAQPEPVEVYLVSPGGRTRLIGQVQASSRETFDFEEIAGGSYRLLARGRTNRRELLSSTFSLIGNRRLEWNLFGNLVSVLERR